MLLLVMAGVIVVGIRLLCGDEDTWLCQNNQWVKHGNPSAPMPTTACISSDNQNLPEEDKAADSGAIEWSEALSLINSCEVLRISQLPNRNVDMWLKDGRQIWAVEPKLDDVLQTVQAASRCGNIIVSTE